MGKIQVSEDNKLGMEILSNAELTRSHRKLKFAVYGLCAIVAFATVSDIVTDMTPEQQPILDASTGQFITTYSHDVDRLTLEERMELARHTYIGLRQRIGISEVDARNLNEWKRMVTGNGARAWKSLSFRWNDLAFIQPGHRRTVEVISVLPDLTTPYAYTVEAIEAEGIRDEPKKETKHLVRFTMFFTDPKVEGTSKLDGMQLHEEGIKK